MLEPIDSYINNTECKYKEYENIEHFLLFYNSECGSKIFNEDKLLNMLRFFKLHDGHDASEIENYGKKFKELHSKIVEIEKQRQRYYGNSDKLTSHYIKNPQYLICIYNKLKQSIHNRTQYIILKDAILCLSPVDTEHFINMLLRKYSTADITQVITKIKND